DASLHCNHLPCRTPLGSKGEACVTSCSHIFCMTCAQTFFTSALVCPACELALPGREDVVVACLDPSDSYKASILAGLRPEIIMEIATRGLRFWTYQVSQELIYRELSEKRTIEKMRSTETQ
ncbi:hypothetical protein BJ085DRAFT_13022, partial [Dimargaris cristalligena]